MAASSLSTKKLVKLLECPICLLTLTIPKSLKCLHFFCQSCIDGMEPKTIGLQPAYECPICQEISHKDIIRPMHVIHDLLQMVDLEKSYPPVMNKHSYCASHPNEMVKLFCKQCEEVICIHCKDMDHSSHKAETIDDALKRILPIIKTNTEGLQKKIKDNEQTLQQMKFQAKDITTGYDKIEKEIDEQSNAVGNVREDPTKAKEHFTEIKEKHLGEVNKSVKLLELKLTSQRNVVSLSQTITSSALGTSLRLQTLHTEVIGTLEAHLQDKSKPAVYQTKPKAKFVRSQSGAGSNLFGIVTEESGPIHSMSIHPLLQNLTNDQIDCVNEIEIDFRCARFAIIGEDLWCVENRTNNIHILTFDGTKRNTKTIDGVGNCRSVAGFKSDIILAASEGLFLIDVNGKVTRVLAKGDFTDSSVMGETIYALDDDVGVVRKFCLDPVQDVYNEETFGGTQYQQSDRNTVQVSHKYVYIALSAAHSILQYTHDGKFIASQGSRGSAIDQIGYPRLCGADADDNLLISDEYNDKFKILSPSGQLKNLGIHCLDKQNFYCVAFQENQILAISFGQIFKRFVFSW